MPTNTSFQFVPTRQSSLDHAQPNESNCVDASLRSVLDRILLDLAAIKDTLAGYSKPFLTIAEVAGLVGRSEYTVRRWISEGRIAATRIDGTGPRGRLLVARDQLARLIDLGSGTNIPSSALCN